MKPGVEYGVELDVTVGVFFDLSLRAAIGSFISDAQWQKLEDYVNGLNLDDSFYEWIYGYDLADMDKITEKLSPKEKAKKKILGSDVGLSCDWKVPIKNEWEPWYPTIVEGSYVIISYYVEEKKKMFFSARFTIDKVGVLFTQIRPQARAATLLRTSIHPE